VSIFDCRLTESTNRFSFGNRKLAIGNFVMDAKLAKKLQQLLSRDTAGRASPRLQADAQRLIDQLASVATLSLTPKPPLIDVLHLACYALQLPMRQSDSLPVGKSGQLNLRQRSEQAAELLVSEAGDLIEETTLDRVTRVLLDLPSREPESDDARLLADVVNLDDFGLTGLLASTVLLATQGHGVSTLLEGAKKREQYGYWEARLRDGFHFPQIRAIAEKRLATMRAFLDRVEAEQAPPVSL